MVLEHIQKLLFDHDCVIIPDFGGLITHYEAAKIHPVRHTFLPPAKRVAFNEKLKLNDGLLISTLAYDKNLTAEAAQHQVTEFVRDLQRDLNQNRRCDLKGVGIFRLNSENKIEFEYIENENYLHDAFGLPELILKPIVAAEPTLLRTLRPEPQTAGKRGFRNYIRRYYRAAAALMIGGVAVTGLYFLSLQTDYNVSAINPVALLQRESKATVTPAVAAPVTTPGQPADQNSVSAEITLPESVKNADWPADTVVEGPIRIAIKPVSNRIVSETATAAQLPAKVTDIPKESKASPAATKPAPNTPKAANREAKTAFVETAPQTAQTEVKRNYTIAEINAALAAGKATIKPAVPAELETKGKPSAGTMATAPVKANTKTTTAAKPTTIKTATERFYVIVNGYTTYENAERNRKIIVKKGRSGKIIEPFGGARLYRLAIADFATKEQALQQLPQLKNKYGSTIWILKH